MPKQTELTHETSELLYSHLASRKKNNTWNELESSWVLKEQTEKEVVFNSLFAWKFNYVAVSCCDGLYSQIA